MLPVNDLTHAEVWTTLRDHAAAIKTTHILNLFGQEPDRSDRMTMTLDGVLVDFSRHLASAETMTILHRLALHQDVKGWFDRMCTGESVNVTEGRAARHTLLRDPKAPPVIQTVLSRMEKLAAKIRASGATDIVHIGIGGSDLGPRMVYDVLKSKDAPRVHFVSNVDPDDLDPVLAALNPATTYVTVASKTFTTHETMLNLQVALSWLGGDGTRVVALTANPDLAATYGIPEEQVLPLWDWVGGRFSLWSAVGFPIVLGCGFKAFKELLAGAHAADVHARTASPETNIPLTMALLGVWYRNFFGAGAHAVLPYAQRLNLLPAFLQQLEMESNGKSVTRDGDMCTYATAPVIFGQPGTNGQHAFYQMLHQGPSIIPCDFIGAVEASGDPIRHKTLMANMLAQGRALMLGKAGPEGHKICPGNRPSTTILLPRLDARNLGLLLALYEHKTVMQGFLWGINPFDQFGVELGKILAKDLLAPPDEVTHNLGTDQSTLKLYIHTFGTK